MSTFSTKGGLYEKAQNRFGVSNGKQLFTYSFYEKHKADAQVDHPLPSPCITAVKYTRLAHNSVVLFSAHVGLQAGRPWYIPHAGVQHMHSFSAVSEGGAWAMQHETFAMHEVHTAAYCWLLHRIAQFAAWFLWTQDPTSKYLCMSCSMSRHFTAGFLLYGIQNICLEANLIANVRQGQTGISTLQGA